jgi:VIT1/CCC1 family predicted Fe2+/Mn2+ transporter
LDDPEFEEEELAQIYVERGVEVDLARKVAVQLMAKDSLGAHARDELGISEITTARPVQAALTSAATFSVGAAAPLALVLLSPSDLLIPTASLTSKGLAEDPKGRGLVRGDGGGFLAGSLVAVLAVFGIFFLTLVF